MYSDFIMFGYSQNIYMFSQNSKYKKGFWLNCPVENYWSSIFVLLLLLLFAFRWSRYVCINFMKLGFCFSCWQRLPDLLCLLHHAAGGERNIDTLEHWNGRLWLLPNQRNGGEDPRTGKCPLHPWVCDWLPVCLLDTPCDLYRMEKPMTGTELWNLMLSQAFFDFEQ